MYHDYTLYNILKKVIFWLIFLWGAIQGVFASDVSIDTYVKAITTNDIDKTWLGLKQQDKQVYHIFNQLCTQIIASWAVTILPSWTTYNPKESLFVTIACNSLQSDKKDKKAENTALLLNTILKRKNIRDMGIICSQSQLGSLVGTGSIGDTDCENRSFNNNLDYPFIFQKIITQVQNDRVNLSLARIYGTIDSKLTEKELANEYIKNHFNTIGLIPEAKNYPDTHKRLTEYIKNGKTIQKETYFINYKTVQDNGSSIGGNITDFFFINSESKTPPNYHKINTDILYNELFFYTLFTSVYTEYLNRFWNANQADIPVSWWQKNITIWEAIILQRWRIEIQTESIKNAVRESIRQLWNLESSYPIHIWFLMYQEDLLNMRNNLAKIYLPLHQLHYKLENVQSKN